MYTTQLLNTFRQSFRLVDARHALANCSQNGTTALVVASLAGLLKKQGE